MRAWPAGLFVGAAIALDLAAAGAEERRFEGVAALVVQPENSWGWDSAIFGALAERGFRVAYGPLPRLPSLESCDLVALSIRRSLTAAEAADLTSYVSRGGAVYGSWGGPFGSPAFLREVCKVAGTKSLRLKRLALLAGPLTKGIPAGSVELARRAGHQGIVAGNWPGPAGWEIVAVRPLPDAVPVARDPGGNVLGVLARHGKGRTAVLGFGPEQDKLLARRQLGPRMLDNLLEWLLEEKLKRRPRGWSGCVTVSLPARARNVKVLVDGRPVAKPDLRDVGSLKRLRLGLAGVAEGRAVTVRATYDPLPKARNVETVIHLPWNTLRAAAASPARLAEYLKSLNATTCQPLLRSAFGHAWYKGMPEDQHDDKLVKQYRGNFLADLIRQCRQRGIRLVAGVYLDNATPVRKYPEVKRLDRQGKEIKDRYGRPVACFNNPKGLEHNLATIEHLLTRYQVGGIVLDDNFELDRNDCYCRYCKEAFRRYCAAKRIPYEDPCGAAGHRAAGAWRQYKQEATRRLAAEVRKVAKAHGVPAGGWVGVGMDATHLAGAFDFLGGMVYATPPRAARGPLSVLGTCRFICLLWAPDAGPETLETEAREAVHAGCPAIGFWVRGKDGGYRMDAKSSAAIRRAFAAARKEWLSFYRENIVSGDPRFVVVEGKATADALTLGLRNTGRRARRRIAGRLDLSAFQPANR